MAKILLAGLDARWNLTFSRVLSELGHAVEAQALSPQTFETGAADLIFAGADDVRTLTLMKRANDKAVRTPIVLVSRMDDTERWLKALEAGATDYFAAPIDPLQLAWIVKNALRRPAAAFAAA